MSKPDGFCCCCGPLRGAYCDSEGVCHLCGASTCSWADLVEHLKDEGLAMVNRVVGVEPLTPDQREDNKRWVDEYLLTAFPDAMTKWMHQAAQQLGSTLQRHGMATPPCCEFHAGGGDPHAFCHGEWGAGRIGPRDYLDLLKGDVADCERLTGVSPMHTTGHNAVARELITPPDVCPNVRVPDHIRTETQGDELEALRLERDVLIATGCVDCGANTFEPHRAGCAAPGQPPSEAEKLSGDQ